MLEIKISTWQYNALCRQHSTNLFFPPSTFEKKEDIEKIVTFKIKDDTVENITDTLQKLEDEMFALAKKMEFEKAAVCRDKITSLKRKLIDL